MNRQIDRQMDGQIGLDQIRIEQTRIDRIEQHRTEQNGEIDRSIDRQKRFFRQIDRIDRMHRIDLSIDGYRIDRFDRLDGLNGFDRLDRLNRQEDRQMIMERKQRKWRQIDLQRDNKNGRTVQVDSRQVGRQKFKHRQTYTGRQRERQTKRKISRFARVHFQIN